MASLTQWTWLQKQLWELVMDREAWSAVVHGVTKRRTRLSDWSELNWGPKIPHPAWWSQQTNKQKSTLQLKKFFKNWLKSGGKLWTAGPSPAHPHFLSPELHRRWTWGVWQDSIEISPGNWICQSHPPLPGHRQTGQDTLWLPDLCKLVQLQCGGQLPKSPFFGTSFVQAVEELCLPGGSSL